MTKKQKKVSARIIISLGMLICLTVFEPGGLLKLMLYAAVYLIIGYDILRKAIKGVFCGRVFDENFLMSVATIGAFALALYTKSGDYAEAPAIMLFYQIGELFQSCAVGKSRKNIGELMDVRPDGANIECGGRLVRVTPDTVDTGSIITVFPGERVPIDGIVAEGESTVDTSALTGESVPRRVGTEDEIVSGCINLSGVLKVRTTKEFGESTVSKILDMVENASSKKSKSEAFIYKFARVYTPSVCGAALAVAVIPPVIGMILGMSARWGVWIYRALSFLVVSCPCALVISIPLSFFAGIGCAGKEGILVKGSNRLEALSETECVVFDKTGTLTEGVFEVNGIHHSAIEERELLELAALAESASQHPISKSLRRAHGGKTDTGRVTDFEEMRGYGIKAVVDGKKVALGNEKMMRSVGVKYHSCHCTGTVVHVASDGEYIGHIVISDRIKKNAERAVALLKETGISKITMLTGDRKESSESVAEKLGIDDVRSGLLPDEKVGELEKILGKGLKTAFVGDGMNDAPVLMRADIGVAMGAMGSDAAIEAADVVLMDDDPMKLVTAIEISKKCIGIVRQNIVFSLAVKLACLILSTVGIANMRLAVFADVGVMVIAVLNSVRALRIGK